MANHDTLQLPSIQEPSLRERYEDAVTRKLEDEAREIVTAAEHGRTIALGSRATSDTIFVFKNPTELPFTD